MSRKFGVFVLAVSAVVLAASGALLTLYHDTFTVALPDYPPTREAKWLKQGWSDRQRDWFHHADQGTQTLNLPYEWFAALEQPRLAPFGDAGRLADPAYLDRFGFIPGATEARGMRLPVGFTRGETMFVADGSPWLNPRSGEPLHAIGFTCAACHTGRLTFGDTALLIDGGSALTNLGAFRKALGLSVLYTKVVPGRFGRFATTVLGGTPSEADLTALRAQLDALLERLKIVKGLDDGIEAQSVVEGFGRLDALNRIGNQLFGLDLGAEGRARNYAPLTAPVSFPHIWNTSWFDWVQYNASIEQPMVRNAGEALGVAAPLNLSDPARPLFASGVQVGLLAEMEKQIAGEQPDGQSGFTGLLAPRWDEVLPAIDRGAAAKGAALYASLCAECHLPPVGSAAFWTDPHWAPPNADAQRYLTLEKRRADAMDTDAAQAVDMRNRRVWLPDGLPIASREFGPALGEVVERAVKRWYDAQPQPISAERRRAMNGFRENGIRAEPWYKARPLDGVWATPPFLHNGAVPNLYALLSPVAERPRTFKLGQRAFDPVCVGYRLTDLAASPSDPGAGCLAPEAGVGGLAALFSLDTSLRGNRNTGHAFTGDGTGGAGVIGRALDPRERLALIEFLKTDCVNGPAGAADRTADPAAGIDTSCEGLAKVAARAASDGAALGPAGAP